MVVAQNVLLLTRILHERPKGAAGAAARDAPTAARDFVNVAPRGAQLNRCRLLLPVIRDGRLHYGCYQEEQGRRDQDDEEAGTLVYASRHSLPPQHFESRRRYPPSMIVVRPTE